MKNLLRRVEQLLETIKQEPRQKWIVLLLLLGVGLYLVSTLMLRDPQQPVKTETAAVQTQKPELEQRLAECLQKVNGVGRTEVILSLAQQQSTVYQVDEHQSSSEASQSIQRNTVIVSGEGLVQTIYAPQYRGAVVICEGGDRASVVQAVKAAVSSLTGLKNDQITVMKMKK
ncbi:MAG: hypothetical protein E7449_00220 [Ruminococcaceae bacterium]|nr:hypothetical protein [Oscillospiraceae bacterium]